MSKCIFVNEQDAYRKRQSQQHAAVKNTTACHTLLEGHVCPP